VIATSEEVCRRRVFSFETISSQRYLEISKKKILSQKCFGDIGRCSINFYASTFFDQLADADLNVLSIASTRNMLVFTVPAQFRKNREIQTRDRRTVDQEKYKKSRTGKDFFIRYSGLMGHHYERVIVPFDGTRIFLKSENLDFQPIGTGAMTFSDFPRVLRQLLTITVHCLVEF
jgi:hypothetical protein